MYIYKPCKPSRCKPAIVYVIGRGSHGHTMFINFTYSTQQSKFGQGFNSVGGNGNMRPLITSSTNMRPTAQ